MHYYPYHIGDFNSQTRHLSFIERAIYRDLLDFYYLTEQPISVDKLEKVLRKITCRTEEEKTIAMAILDEFFILKDGHYHNNRCDKEITDYRAKLLNSSKAGKASAEKRKEKSKASSVQQENNSCSTSVATQEQQTNNQEPPTNNQEPPTNNQEPLIKKPCDILNVSVLGELLELWNPEINIVNEYLETSSVPTITLDEFRRQQTPFLTHYSNDIKAKKLDGTYLMGKFVAWIQRQHEWNEKKMKSMKDMGNSPWETFENLEKLV